MGVLDEYPCERFCFQVQGYNIPIRSEILANALVKLSEKKRDMLTVRFLRLQKGKMTEYFGWIDNYQLCAQPRVCSLTGGNPVYPRPNQPDISESWDGISNGI